MYNLLFGKRRSRKVRKARKVHKLPTKIVKMCRYLKIKCTKKVGNHRVQRSLTVLKRLIKKRMKMRKSHKKVRRVKRVRRVRQRRSRFGSSIGGFSNAGPSNYGYNQKVEQYPNILSQSSQMVTSGTNQFRPNGLGLSEEYVPTYGVGRQFFTETVPTQVGPNWNFMGQPDGTMYPVGGPFSRYTSPAFGRRRMERRRRFGDETPKKTSYTNKAKEYYAKMKAHPRYAKMKAKAKPMYAKMKAKAKPMYAKMKAKATQRLNMSPHYIAAKYAAKNSGLMFGKRRSVCRNCMCSRCKC